MESKNEKNDEPTKLERYSYSWKYIGYRVYSAFIGSDRDFLVVRRFSVLNSRILLRLQDEVVKLEEDLIEFDTAHSAKAAGLVNANNSSFRNDQRDRRALLSKIHEQLNIYYSFALQVAQISTLPEAQAWNVASVQNWHHNNRKAINAKEIAYLLQTDDLIALVHKDMAPMRRLFERFTLFRHFRFWKKDAPSFLPVYEQDTVNFYDDKKIDQFVFAVTMCLGILMLISPLWILNSINGPSLKLGVITAFIVVFCSIVSVATAARPGEVLAATAAYSAVLVVFLQLGTPGNK